MEASQEAVKIIQTRNDKLLCQRRLGKGKDYWRYLGDRIQKAPSGSGGWEREIQGRRAHSFFFFNKHLSAAYVSGILLLLHNFAWG